MSDPTPYTAAGYQGQIFVGNAGQTAKTLLTNVQDIDYQTETEFTDITERNPVGSKAPPPKSEWPVAVEGTVTWSMLEKSSDSNLPGLINAARTAKLVAIRTLGKVTGKGLDADCGLQVQHEQTLAGIGKYNFTAKPCDMLRDIQLDA